MSATIAEAVLHHVRKIEAGLKPDETLLVYCATTGGEKIRALNIQFTDGPLVLVHGQDDGQQFTTVMMHAFSFQMICKVVKSQPDVKKNPIGFVMPPKAGETD
jgi:hypothetical protein